ncbi:hypothetical protein F2P81_007223 [Scophthalmus maximus]|uniref:Uncharacterized protein n=1 Tax=Scophthalmus maximus TaxID=52904 RepID=A0A6A4T827_SCOMX|nr:hypothetical protein F2P81_007223 [Scophthalmus maximus]
MRIVIAWQLFVIVSTDFIALRRSPFARLTFRKKQERGGKSRREKEREREKRSRRSIVAISSSLAAVRGK